MTTKSSVRNIKPRLPTSNTINTMSTNGNDYKASRIYVKRPLSTTNFLQNNSATNGLSNQLKKRTLQLNNFFNSKTKSNQSNEHSPSPPLIFHAIAPAPSEDTNNPSKETNGDHKSNDEQRSPTSRRIAHVLSRTNIRTMSTDQDSKQVQSSCSEDEENEKKSKYEPVLSSIDADADESDNGNNKTSIKFRRFQKTRKISNTLLPQKYDNNHHHHDQHHSSSNDEEIKEFNSCLNGNNERRTKIQSNKKSLRAIPTTTTTDDDTIKKVYHYHPLDILEESKVSIPPPLLPPPLPPPISTTNESNLSSPNPIIDQTAGKKINRFQVKSIRKSQQQQILLANAAAAKSSNDDDCSVPNDKSNLQLKPSIISRKNTMTPTTDLENSIPNTDNITNGTLNTIENGHHRVRFHVTQHEKKQSTIEDDKLHNHTTTVPVPTPAPPSSTASAQGEDDEEEEAIGKSPDNRFIKYAKEIGRGAFKTVYRGLDTEASVAVAWCELQEFAHFDKHERARFKEEAEMLKKLQHPNIVRFYDFWEETNLRTNKKVIILVTELMTSGSLKGYIRKFKGQKEEKRINVMKKWCRQILKGLAYLHSRNPPVIHRDLKCDNVFISSTTGCVKIGDLGLATFKTQTFAKSMRGTMEFMAPEMFDEKYDELVDIYSFGLCMLEMITGEYPYIECKGPTAVIKRVTAGLKPDCYYKVESEDVREVIDCCIRTNKEERLPVNELLQHSFFLDDNGLRIDFVRDPSNDLQVVVNNNSVDLKLKIIDKTKRKALWTEHEAIRFRYNFTTDTPEQIVDELIEKKYIFDEDKKFIIQAIKDRLRAYQYEQIDRKAGVFCRDRKPTITTPHPPPPQQQQQQQQQLPIPPQPTAPLAIQPQVVSTPSRTPTPTVVQQTAIEIPQQQVIKPSTESSQTKPNVPTEPIPIAQLSDLSSSVSGSAGSLEILDAALKKTFNKLISQNPNIISTLTNDTNETPTSSLVNQDESSISKHMTDVPAIDQQPKEEAGGITNDDLSTTTLQSQSQPTTMVTNYQPQISPKPLFTTQTSQTLSCPTTQSSQHLINQTDTNKQSIPSSSTTTTNSILTETVENNHISISPSHANETSIPSDTTTQPNMLGSLKHLDALLKDTFKNPHKANGTAHNSDTETTTTNISLPVNEEISLKSNDIDTDEAKRKVLDRFNSANPHVSSNVQSQPNTSSIILSKSISQVKSQPTTSQNPLHFDPLISPERENSENKTLSNDDTITASSTNDLSEIKLMIMDLSKTLINRMNILENKIDEHKNQTIQINNLLTNTVLPSLFDLADIIHQTPNLDSRVRTKLENIQMNIRSSQQQQQQQTSTMKDLMDI